jgi:hypothetical protein
MARVIRQVLGIHPLPPIVGYASLGGLVVWRVYSRFRRLLKRQRLSKYRAPITLAIYPVLLILAVLLLLPHLLNLLMLVIAFSSGAALGVFGLKHTKFETIPNQGLFYTPNIHIGIALSLLFVTRIVFRIVEVFIRAPTVEYNLTEFAQSPFTLVTFGLLAGYNMCYSIGLLRWRARVFCAKQA